MSPPRLLIVDDEPANLAIMRRILEPSYALPFARHGTDAIELAKRHRLDLALLAIQMPNLDGDSVRRALQADARTAFIPVILVTTQSELGHETQGFAVGGVDYLITAASPAVSFRFQVN